MKEPNESTDTKQVLKVLVRRLEHELCPDILKYRIKQEHSYGTLSETKTKLEVNDEDKFNIKDLHIKKEHSYGTLSDTKTKLEIPDEDKFNLNLLTKKEESKIDLKGILTSEEHSAELCKTVIGKKDILFNLIQKVAIVKNPSSDEKEDSTDTTNNSVHNVNLNNLGQQHKLKHRKINYDGKHTGQTQLMCTMTLLSEPSFSAYSWASQGGFGNQTVVDKVPPEMLYLVDAHWYQFPPMNPLWHSLLGFAMVILGFICVTGNGMVVYIFSCTKALRTPSNLLVVNLAFSDFLMMFTMAPPMVLNCYYETWVLGPFMCEVYAMLGSVFGCTSIWTMVMIANDRYNVIVKGLSAKPMTIKSALARILFCWAHSLIWTLSPFFGWGRYVPEGNMTACGTDYLSQDWVSKSYILVYSFFVYFLPLFLIIYSYWFIVQAVSAHEKSMREQAKKMNVASLRSSDAANTSAEHKLAKVALMTISLWFCAWTPYLVINWAGTFQALAISPLFTIWGSVFAKANACYNPIVYAISHPKYRAALNKKFPSLVCGNADMPASSDGTSVASGATTLTTEDKSAAA